MPVLRRHRLRAPSCAAGRRPRTAIDAVADLEIARAPPRAAPPRARAAAASPRRRPSAPPRPTMYVVWLAKAPMSQGTMSVSPWTTDTSSKRSAQLLGDDLRERGVRAGAQPGGAGEQDDRAVLVHLHDGVALLLDAGIGAASRASRSPCPSRGAACRRSPCGALTQRRPADLLRCRAGCSPRGHARRSDGPTARCRPRAPRSSASARPGPCRAARRPRPSGCRARSRSAPRRSRGRRRRSACSCRRNGPSRCDVLAAVERGERASCRRR